MKYRLDKKGNAISQLGFGCMRFAKKGTGIDYAKAEEQVMYAIEHGVNYFDTAYIYSGSEECLGAILQKNDVREKVYIATKLPQYTIRSSAAIEKIFQEELKRLKTNYIDYYLMHMFTDYSEWERLDSYGVREFIQKHKEDGSIRNIGFSYHGNTEMFLKLLDCYDWDFCQIQYNYLDETTQAGRIGLESAEKKGIPVVIMEPLRGGKLVNLPSKAKEILRGSAKKYTSAELGLRWLWDQKGVTCVLSGMNSMEMVQENIRLASEVEAGVFDQEDFKLVDDIKKIIREKEKVGCTGCRYCMPCPMGVDIPGNFYYYNLMSMESKGSGRFGFGQTMGLRQDPGFASQCVGCGKCEKHCPQHLPIRQYLKDADKALRPFYVKAGISVARKLMGRNKKPKSH